MTLTKANERTSRRPCKKCGSTDYYWGENPDAERHAGRFVMVEANAITRAVPKGGAFPEGHLHACKSEHTDPTPDEIRAFESTIPAETAKDETVPAANTAVKAPETAPKAVPTSAPSGEVASAFQTLMQAMAPGVDADAVRAIVQAEMANVVYPTRTVVVKEGKAPRTIPGATHSKLADVIKVLSTGEHVLMVGPAGTGKSTIAEQAAQALELKAYSLSLSPQTSTASVFGYMHATGGYVRTLFRDAFEFGGVFNFDELDNGHPSILAAINGALANGHAAFPDGMVTRSADFRCVGSANTYGRGADRKYVGRQALDAATLDRFTFLTIDIDESLERQLCESTDAGTDTVGKVLMYVRKIRKNVDTSGLPVVVSPRASVGLCRLLAAGFSVPDAIDARVRRGLSDQDWNKISGGVSF